MFRRQNRIELTVAVTMLEQVIESDVVKSGTAARQVLLLLPDDRHDLKQHGDGGQMAQRLIFIPFEVLDDGLGLQPGLLQPLRFPDFVRFAIGQILTQVDGVEPLL